MRGRHHGVLPAGLNAAKLRLLKGLDSQKWRLEDRRVCVSIWFSSTVFSPSVNKGTPT